MTQGLHSSDVGVLAAPHVVPLAGLRHRLQRLATVGLVPMLFATAALALASGSLRAQEGSAPAGAVHRVSGEVFDSLAFEPLAGALVAVRPSGVTTTTDSAGRFSVLVEQPATEITVYHGALDEIGLGALVAARPANAGDWTDARLTTPSLLTLWPRLCDSEGPQGTRSAVLMGTARLPDNVTRLAGARVLVQWQPSIPKADDAPLETVEAITDSIGNYIACGVEEFVEPLVLAQSREAESGVVRLPASARSVRRADLVLAAIGSSTPTRELRGQVVDADGQPVAGMTVQVDGRAGVVATGQDGTFVLDRVPYGSRMLTARTIGYIPVSQVVDVTMEDMPTLSIPVSASLELDAVTITERATARLQREEFDDRRQAGIARFMDSTVFSNVATIRTGLQMLSNVRVVPRYDTRFNTTEFFIRGRSGCSAHLYMDGTLTNIDEVNRIPLENLAAVESYSSVSLAPARFSRVMADDCAVVLFWTKWALQR